MTTFEGSNFGLLPEWSLFEKHYIAKGIPHRFVVRPEPAVALFVDEHGARFGALLAVQDGVIPSSPLEEIAVRDVRLNGVRYLEISTTHRSLYRNFFFFVSDIVSTTIEGTSPYQAFSASVARWNALLQTPTLLGEERQRGLYGELWMLRRLYSHIGLSAFEAWTGPANQAHDFRLNACEFEVKTTASSERVHIINGTHQLEPSPDCELYILSLQLADGGSGGTTLPDLVDEILDLTKASQTHTQGFLKTLGGLGFDLAKRDKYPHRRKLRSPAKLIPVVDGCPRLLKSVVTTLPSQFAPERIGRINYEVNLGGLGFEDGEPAFLALLPK